MQVGDLVEDFPATLDDGTVTSLAQLVADGPAVFFFYPKAFTPGCTAQACHFRDLAADFAAVGAQRFGVSRDDADTQARFAEAHGLDFPLIADTSGHVAKVFGAKRPAGLWSKRRTYVVGRDRRLLGEIASEANMEVHADQALALLQDA